MSICEGNNDDDFVNIVGGTIKNKEDITAFLDDIMNSVYHCYSAAQ